MWKWDMSSLEVQINAWSSVGL